MTGPERTRARRRRNGELLHPVSLWHQVSGRWLDVEQPHGRMMLRCSQSRTVITLELVEPEFPDPVAPAEFACTRLATEG